VFIFLVDVISQALAALSDRFPTHGFDELVRATLACVSRPLSAMSLGAAALHALDAEPNDALR